MTETVTARLNKEGVFRLPDDADTNRLNPKELLLYAATQCSGQTLMRILEKERTKPRRVEITASGELSTETLMPESVFVSFNMVYNVECDTIEDQIKVSRAVNLTHDKYCGMLRMLRMIAPVAHEIAIVSNEPVGK